MIRTAVLSFCCLFVLSLFLDSCTTRQHALLQPAVDTGFPGFYDDLDRDSLLEAIHASLNYLQHQPSHLGGDGVGITPRRLVATLEAFEQLLRQNLPPARLNRLLKTRFTLYQAPAAGRSRCLVTGYYQPVFPGSLKQNDIYRYPIYRIPPDLALQHHPGAAAGTIGRLVGERLLPYWTRAEIEQEHRPRGSELAWLADPLDVFFLHIQGSGLIRLPDSTLRGVHYAMKNGQPYRSIGKYLVQSGQISLEEASLDTIRRYLTRHPEKIQDVLQHNPSYIFFDWAPRAGATGNLNQVLTAGRSIAADQNWYPAGALAFLMTRQPVVRDGRIIYWKPLHRFVLIQDSGSAIRGPARIDLFWGTGPEAGMAAGAMKEPGTIFLVLLKEEFGS